MSYYTDHNLQLEGKEADIKRFVNFLEKHEDERITEDCYDYGHVLRIIDNTDNMKWYSFTKDMVKVSKDWPTIQFIAECKGEDMDCPYRLYFWGGKFLKQNAKIVWEDIDLNSIAPLSVKLDKVLEEV